MDVSFWRSCTHRVGVKVEANPTLPGQPYRRQQTGYISPVPISKPWEAQNAAGAAPSEGNDSRET